MKLCFEVLLEDKPAGTVTLAKEGMYYMLQCLCSIPMSQRYNLVIISGDTEADLGVCIPYSKGFGLKVRIKAAIIADQNIRFVLKPKAHMEKTEFYPVDENLPFVDLERLEDAFLLKKDGQIGIIFHQGSMEISKPTGQ